MPPSPSLLRTRKRPMGAPCPSAPMEARLGRLTACGSAYGVASPSASPPVASEDAEDVPLAAESCAAAVVMADAGDDGDDGMADTVAMTDTVRAGAGSRPGVFMSVSGDTGCVASS